MAAVSTLKRKGSYWYCNNCMVRQPEIVPQCVFCEIPFSNFETLLIEAYKNKEESEIKDEKNIYNRNRTK